jgi:hypothetical protein
VTDGSAAPLRAIVELLDRAAIPYMVVGSFASMVHGVPRTTQDLDIVIDPSAAALDQFLREIDIDRFYVDPDVARDALRRRSMFNVIDMDSAWKVDLVIRKDRAFSIEELRRRTLAQISDVQVPTATAEDTIISKLEWSKASNSERQLLDVAGILRVRSTNLDLDYIEHWVDALDLRPQWDRVRGLTQ